MPKSQVNQVCKIDPPLFISMRNIFIPTYTYVFDNVVKHMP